MLKIPDDKQQQKTAKNIAHQQVLSAKKMGYKHKNMSRLLKRDWKSIGMATETITDLVHRLQPIITALKKKPRQQVKYAYDNQAVLETSSL